MFRVLISPLKHFVACVRLSNCQKKIRDEQNCSNGRHLLGNGANKSSIDVMQLAFCQYLIIDLICHLQKPTARHIIPNDIYNSLK